MFLASNTDFLFYSVDRAQKIVTKENPSKFLSDPKYAPHTRADLRRVDMEPHDFIQPEDFTHEIDDTVTHRPSEKKAPGLLPPWETNLTAISSPTVVTANLDITSMVLVPPPRSFIRRRETKLATKKEISCNHCLIPTQECDYGRVNFTLDLNAAQCMPDGNEKRLRDELGKEVCLALHINRMQIKIGPLKRGSIIGTVRFAACQDIARMQNCAGICVLSSSMSDAGIPCLCPSRRELVDRFLHQCGLPDSRLRRGKLFGALRPNSAKAFPFGQAPTCVKCDNSRGQCDCTCKVCKRPLDACWFKCCQIEQDERFDASRLSDTRADAHTPRKEEMQAKIERLEQQLIMSRDMTQRNSADSLAAKNLLDITSDAHASQLQDMKAHMNKLEQQIVLSQNIAQRHSDDGSTAAAMRLMEIQDHIQKLERKIENAPVAMRQPDSDASQLQDMKAHVEKLEQQVVLAQNMAQRHADDGSTAAAMRLMEMQNHIQKLEKKIMNTQEVAMMQPRKDDAAAQKYEQMQAHIKRLETQVAVAQDIALESRLLADNVAQTSKPPPHSNTNAGYIPHQFGSKGAHNGGSIPAAKVSQSAIMHSISPNLSVHRIDPESMKPLPVSSHRPNLFLIGTCIFVFLAYSLMLQ